MYTIENKQLHQRIAKVVFEKVWGEIRESASKLAFEEDLPTREDMLDEMQEKLIRITRNTIWEEVLTIVQAKIKKITVVSVGVSVGMVPLITIGLIWSEKHQLAKVHKKLFPTGISKKRREIEGDNSGTNGRESGL